MTDTLPSIYDYPKYYDLVYGSDWKAEYNFLGKCIDRYPDVDVQHVFEPACGTGRILYRFGKADYAISGLDLNEKSIDFCNRRFKRHGLPETAFVADMCDFQLPTSCDAAFNMVNSFRHLGTEKQAVAHFNAMRDAMSVGGIYVLGLHLSPLKGETCDQESWSASRGHLTVNSSMWLVDRNLGKRYEDYGMRFSVYTPTETKQMENVIRFRTYSAKQFTNLIDKIQDLEIVATHDFRYDIDYTVELDEEVEDVVFIIKRTS